MLWEKASQQRRSIASTTKIMTALVVLERTELAEVVTASAAAEAVGANDPLVTELELKAGEKLTVEQLLYGMLLPSANDAAVALAEHVGGSVAGFAGLMERQAADLGLKGSSFADPAGFDHPDHYSTAADLAVMARSAMKHEVFRRIVATQTYELPSTGIPRLIKNRNPLLGSYSGADGIKTGQTRAAGRSLVASATRAGESRIAVVLSSTDPAGDAAALLDHGFAGFRRFVLSTRGTPWGLVTRGAGETFAVVPSVSATALLPVNAEDPVSRYQASRGRIVAELGAGQTLHAPARLVCLKTEQDCRTRRGMTIMERLLSLLGPLAR